MQNYIITITYNRTDETGKETENTIRLVNPAADVIGATLAQVTTASNWLGRIFVQRDAVNAVFGVPPQAQPVAKESPETPAEKPKEKKPAAKKTTAKKVNGTASKKAGRPKAKKA